MRFDDDDDYYEYTSNDNQLRIHYDRHEIIIIVIYIQDRVRSLRDRT